MRTKPTKTMVKPSHLLPKPARATYSSGERYKHLSPAFKQQTVELIAGQLSRHVSTFLSPASKNTNGRPEGRPQVPQLRGFNGGADGTRTRDLRRDRSKSRLNRINNLPLPSTI